MENYIYETLCWGNNDDDPMDTMFLVRAASFEEAAQLVATEYRLLSKNGVASFCQCVHEIGISLGHGASPHLLRGPYYGRSYTFGGRRWQRVEENGKWELFQDSWVEKLS